MEDLAFVGIERSERLWAVPFTQNGSLLVLETKRTADTSRVRVSEADFDVRSGADAHLKAAFKVVRE